MSNQDDIKQENNNDSKEKEILQEDKDVEKNDAEKNRQDNDSRDLDNKDSHDNDQSGKDKKEKKDKKHHHDKHHKDKRDEEIAELKDKLVRQLAEFDNYRKRTDIEKSKMFDFGAKDVLEKILPIVDNLERGLSAVTEEQKEQDSFVMGVSKVYEQLLDIFENIGVKAIPAVNQEFNPELHNAVMHIDDDNYGENVIVEEFQKGYSYKDSVIRHSMVKVAN